MAIIWPCSLDIAAISENIIYERDCHEEHEMLCEYKDKVDTVIDLLKEWDLSRLFVMLFQVPQSCLTSSLVFFTIEKQKHQHINFVRRFFAWHIFGPHILYMM